MRIALLFVAVVVVAANSGCALTRLMVQDPYDPEPSRADRGHGRTVSIALPWANEREQSHRCGMKRNGYGFDTADVVCDTQPEEFLAQRLRARLAAAGFQVVDDPAAATWQVNGVVTQFFMAPDVGFVTVNPETDIGLMLVVTNATTGLRAERRFYVKRIEVSIAATDEAIQRSINGAVREETSVVADAIIDLIDRHSGAAP